MDLRTTLENLRWGYLWRMVTPFPLYGAVTVLYFYFGQDLDSWEQLAGTLLFLVFWNVMVTGGLAAMLYHFHILRKQEAGRAVPRLDQLSHRSRNLVFAVGLIYVGFISWMGYQTQPESYARFNEVMDFTLSILFSYVVIPVYTLSILLEQWTMKAKDRLHRAHGLNFPPGRNRLRNELLAAFVILALYPLGSVFINLWSLGLLGEILARDPYMVSYGAITLTGVLVILVAKTRTLTLPLELVSSAVESIRRGEYSRRVPVVVENELGHLSEKINAMASGLEEKERMRDLFGRAVDPTVRDALLSRGSRLGGELRDLTLVFSDIRDFTVLSESRRPEEVVSLLNRYFERMNRCIQTHGGVVNKYMGDAILAVFGLEGDPGSGALGALRASADMQKALADLNRELVREGLPPLEAGIGIHRDRVIAGTVGSETRMEYTVIGDGVNLASRIEGLSKLYARGAVVTRETLDSLGNSIVKGLSVRPLLITGVKGKKKMVELWELLDGLPEDIKNPAMSQRQRYIQAREMVLQGEGSGTHGIWDTLLAQSPEDKIYQYWKDQAQKNS